MTVQQAIELVNDLSQWKGNAFTLATILLSNCREDHATIVELMEGSTTEEIAAAIRNH